MDRQRHVDRQPFSCGGAGCRFIAALVPIDSSENSFRALEFAVEVADWFGTDLHAIHMTDVKTSTTEDLLDRIHRTLEDTPFEDDPEVIMDT